MPISLTESLGDSSARRLLPNLPEEPTQQFPDDELLIRRAFQTDASQGCDLLFRRYYQPLCSQAVRLVYDKSLAEDIVADIFQTLWQKRLYERIQYSYRAYLYQAVRQNCLLYLKREAGRTILSDQRSGSVLGSRNADDLAN